MSIRDPMPSDDASPPGSALERADFRAIVEHCSTAIVVQCAGRIVYVNRAAVDSLEFGSAAELIDRPLEVIFDTDSYATLSSNFQKAGPDDDQLFIGDLRLRRRSGNLMDAEVYHSSVIFDRAHGTMMSIRDVTVTKRLELELRQSQKLESIGRLAARLAHEINTPIQYVGDSAHYVAELVDGLLQLLDKSRADLRKLAVAERGEKALAELSAEEEAADLEFMRIEGPRSVERIKGGAARVARIVSAMKSFSHPGGEEASPMDINKIFEPFFTTKQVGRGTGQGMTVVRTAAHKHGGSIDFESTWGVGTKFVLRLPLEQSP